MAKTKAQGRQMLQKAEERPVEAVAEAVPQVVPTTSAAIRLVHEARLAAAGQGQPDFNDPLLADEVARVRKLTDESHAKRTLEEYKHHYVLFENWCEEHKYRSLPAAVETLLLYLTHLADDASPRCLAGQKPRSIGVAVAAIAYEHNCHELTSPHQSPKVRRLLKGITNRKGLAPAQKTPAVTTVVQQVVAVIDEELTRLSRRSVKAKLHPRRLIGRRLICLRDRALLLVGFAGAFRREELVNVAVEGLVISERGMIVAKSTLINRSKTDQAGKGQAVFIPRDEVCPVRATQEWIAAAGIDFSWVFVAVSQWGYLGAQLCGSDVARILKKRAVAAGLDTTKLSGHSLRSGFATSAANAGKPLRQIMEQLGHKDPKTTMGYIRVAQGFDENAAVGLLKKTLVPASPRC